MISQKEISIYLKQVKKSCNPAFRGKLATDLKNSLSDFLEENPDCAMEDITEHFGEPEQFADEYILAMDDAERRKLVNHSKWIKRVVLIGVVAVVLIVSATMIGVIQWNAEHKATYYEDEIADNGFTEIVNEAE